MRAAARSGEVAPRDPFAWARWLLLMVRVHPHLTILIVVATALRVVVLVAYQPALLLHADAYGYLRVAESLEPSAYRPSLYPLLLRFGMLTHSLVPIVVVQHLVGLALAVAIYARLRRFGVGAGGAAAGAAPMFLDAYQLNIEHYILSETLFQALVVGALFALTTPRTHSYGRIAAAAVLLGLAGTTRVAGIALIVPVLIYLVWRKVGVRKLAAALAGFILPLAVYASWYQQVWGGYAITRRGPLILYGRVSPFADCSIAGLPDYQRGLCDVRPPEDRPGTEFYVWRTEHPLNPLLDFEPPAGKNEQEALGEFARKIILAQPFDYARVVIGDLAHYFAPGRWEEPRDAQMEPWEFTDVIDLGPTDPATLKEQQATGDNLPKVIRDYRGSPEPSILFGPGGPPDFVIVRPAARFLDRYQDFVYTPGPLLALAVLVGSAGIFVRHMPARRRPLRAECFLFTSCGFGLLFIPAASAVFEYRYLLPALPLLGVAGSLGAHELLRRFGPRGRRKLVLSR